VEWSDAVAVVKAEAGSLDNPQTDLPRLAKEPGVASVIDRVLREVPTTHLLVQHDARDMSMQPDASVQLVVTSPPYWTLKEYRDSPGQLGHVEDYELFLSQLDRVWQHSLRVLVPGGRLIVVVGDVCLSRRRNHGRHTVIPLHSSISEHCRRIGFDGLAPIIWHKIANAAYEAEGNGAGFLGKPYEPNAVIKNDVEYILMLRKPGGYRSPSLETRLLSLISADNHRRWFQQVWTDVTGASTKNHPAPFPMELAERLIRMFTFAGDTVLDPFTGTGTTNIAASLWGRNSIGIEIDPMYVSYAEQRFVGKAPRSASLKVAAPDRSGAASAA
jgi:DNA modification methylase